MNIYRTSVDLEEQQEIGSDPETFEGSVRVDLGDTLNIIPLHPYTFCRTEVTDRLHPGRELGQ